MRKYGTDKPDLRNPIEIADVTRGLPRLEDVTFNAFKNAIKARRRGAGDPGAGAAAAALFFDKLNDWAQGEGAAGPRLYLLRRGGRRAVGKGPIAKFIAGRAHQRCSPQAPASKAGDARVLRRRQGRQVRRSFAGAGAHQDRQRARARSTRTASSSAGSSISRCTSGTRRRRRSTSRTTRSRCRTSTREFLALDPTTRTIPRHQGVPVRHRLQRHRTVVRRDPQPSARHHAQGVRDRRLSARTCSSEKFGGMLRALQLRRAAARRHRARHRPHRHAARRRGEPARGGAVPDEPARRGPAHGRAVRGDGRSSCASCTSA